MTTRPRPTDAARRAPMWRRTLRSPWLLLVAALAILLPLEPRLRQMRQSRYPLAGSPAGQPVWVQVVMVGLGGFRGLISEVLWLRASRLQEQGRYFEQVQLAEWITALDPRATDAWVFNAWNLAYNISAMMPRHTDRLIWIEAGIALLRDRAIPANPSDARLYRELGWLFQNKVGEDFDAAHLLYKLELARGLADALLPDGAPPAADSEAAALLLARFRLDAVAMRRLEEELGARFDWRLPHVHAIYWAWNGLPFADGFEHQALRRMIHQNLMVLVERGRFTGDLAQGRYETRPDLGLIPVTERFLEATVRQYPNERDIHARFLAVAIRFLTRAGDAEGARQRYDRLRQLAGQRHYLPPLEQLAAGEIPEDFFQPLPPPPPAAAPPAGD
ncbi:MAG: hypothetical protein GX590_08815 [Lentisphaerae bacterium]|nr:hypothetical protein [Lentisphaerota bacterium]